MSPQSHLVDFTLVNHGQMVPRVPSPKPDTQECVGGTKLVGVRDRLKRPQNRFCLAGCHLHEVDDDGDDDNDDDDDDDDDGGGYLDFGLPVGL